MRYSEEWAVGAERIAEFFRSQADVEESEDCFVCGTCTISLTALPSRPLGPV